MTEKLHFLIFDLLDADEQSHTWEAMASVPPGQASTVLQEVCTVAAWASMQTGCPPQPLDEGGEWDMWLQAQIDQAAPFSLDWSPAGSGQPSLHVPDGTDWVTLTLTLVANGAWASRFQQHLDQVSAV